MRDEKGKFLKGYHISPETEFKKGEHWREKKPYWDKEWLEKEYIEKKKSAKQIADEWEITENAILYWLGKYDIPRRNMTTIRKIKHWSLQGETNGMYGRTGKDNPRWLGGISPERQAFYSSQEWTKVCSETWKRDNATCQRCNKTKVKMHIHHKTSFANVELRAKLSNLVLLCEECHHFIHSKRNTEDEFIGCI